MMGALLARLRLISLLVRASHGSNNDLWRLPVAFVLLQIGPFACRRALNRVLAGRHVSLSSPSGHCETRGRRFVIPHSESARSILATWQEVFAPYPPNGHQYLSRDCAVGQGDVVFDVGAAEGFFAQLAWEKGARYIACFEPSLEWCHSLRQTFAREISDHHIVVCPTLIGLPVEQPGSESLDDLVFKRGLPGPNLIKLDVEGAELDVLKSARRVISEFRPRIAAAVYHTSAESDRCAQFLRACHRGYRIEFRGAARSMDNGAMVPQVLNAWSTSQ